MLSDGSIFDDKFEILAPLGMGGYGIVYKARQLSMDRVVALKILHSQSGVSVETVKRFEREAKILSALQNKHLVLFYAFGVANQNPYIAMEMLDGLPLQSLLSEQPRFDPMRAISIARQILEALSCAHANGVFHRDLKPSNVMVVREGSNELIKVIDFGLAGISDNSSFKSQKLTETGSTVGTVEYMSPEQITGHEATARSDIYAAACIFYRCLCGESPFSADNNIAVMQRHLYDEPKKLVTYAVDTKIAARLQPIIDTALAVEPEQRYQTADDMLEDLARAQRGEQPIYSNPKIEPRAAGAMSSRKWKTPLVATIFGITALAVGIVVVTQTLVKSSNNSDQQAHRNVRSIDLYSEGHQLFQRTVEVDPRIYSHGDVRHKISGLFNRALALSKSDGLLSDEFKTEMYDFLAVANRVEAEEFLHRPTPSVQAEIQGREQLRVAKEYAKQVIQIQIAQGRFDTRLESAVQGYLQCCAELGDRDEGTRMLKKVIGQWHKQRVSHPFYLETSLLDDYLERKQPQLAVTQGRSFIDQMPSTHEAYPRAVQRLKDAEEQLRAERTNAPAKNH